MKQLSHSSHRHRHPHPLHVSEVLEEDNIICSGCELDLFGPAYTCTKPTCGFVLHNSCLDLPQRIRHRSHPKHPLYLLSSPPYNDSEFTCDACGDSGYGFTFHCSTCNFDLRVGCASMPETEEREDHDHTLTLFYSFPKEDRLDLILICDVCHYPIAKTSWVYYCKLCRYGTHLDCVTSEDGPNEE